MPGNNTAFARNYTSVIDEVYQRASVSGVLNSGRRMVRAGHNAKEILIPEISVTGQGDYTRNVGYKTGAITYEFDTKTFNRVVALRDARRLHRGGPADLSRRRHGRSRTANPSAPPGHSSTTGTHSGRSSAYPRYGAGLARGRQLQGRVPAQADPSGTSTAG